MVNHNLSYCLILNGKSHRIHQIFIVIVEQFRFFFVDLEMCLNDKNTHENQKHSNHLQGISREHAMR